MTPETVLSQLLAADSCDWDAVWSSWWNGPLRPLAVESIPSVIAAYDDTAHWQARAAQLYYCTGFSRTRSDVCRFAIHALTDKSIEVRYRACGLLAFSRRRRLIPKLNAALVSANDATKRYLSAAMEAIDQRSMAPFTALDTSRRGFYHLPVVLPCRNAYAAFAEEFDAAAWKWLRALGFERQSVFQHDAYYRKGDLWFHAYWEQWDVVWLFTLGNRIELEQSFVGSRVPQDGNLKEVSRLLAVEVTERLQN